MELNHDIIYKDWLNLRLHLFWCYDGKIGQDRHAPNQVQSFSEFDNNGAWLIRKGWAKVEYNNETYIAMPGQWLIPKPCSRIQSFAANTEVLSISFEASWPDGSKLFDDGLALVIDAKGHPQLENKALPIAEALKALAPNSWDARAYPANFTEFMTLNSLLSQWLIELEKILREKQISHSGQFNIDERVMQAIRKLNEKKLSEKLDIKQLAESVYLSPNHLIRLFYENINKSPAQYYENIRIEYAKKRLLIPDSRIQDTSLSLGFKHLSHFSKWFKKHCDQSPRDYIKTILNS
ncbi:helix-turn-helix transcriptional regulator [Lentisphaera marina]|uniref:AraC family transcriptional regulator n=1 Tax=Lentisphaera marina TaxID=1111041 RepID=UPI0023667392|nr:AraC family transcriptional regulator [Lentisphaera marina]MDD7985251.1 helix-turn-helix transcriptional regulator [Lentisphaera marina]